MTPDLDRPQSDDDGLEMFFAPARAAPQPSEALMARILQDAAGSLAPPVRAAAPAKAAPGTGLLRGLIAALGGWPALGGMAAATVAGVWLGFTSPALITGTGYLEPAYTLSDLMPSAELAMLDTDWTE